MAKKKITTQRNNNSVEKEYARNQRNFGKGFLKDVTVDFAYSQFAVYQLTKGNSKQTIAFYDRFYKKYCSFIRKTFNKEPEESFCVGAYVTTSLRYSFVCSVISLIPRK